MNDENIFNIANAGLLLTSRGDEMELLDILLSIEDILDKGRGLLSGSAELKSEINTKMDELRKRVRDILDSMDKDEAKRFLIDRAERLKTQFPI